MTFHESYGELPKSTLRLIRRYNVSPADYTDLEMFLGQGNFKEIEGAIKRHSDSGSFSTYSLHHG